MSHADFAVFEKVSLFQAEVTDYDFHADTLWSGNNAVGKSDDIEGYWHIQVHDNEGTPLLVYPALHTEEAAVLWAALAELPAESLLYARAVARMFQPSGDDE